MDFREHAQDLSDQLDRKEKELAASEKALAAERTAWAESVKREQRFIVERDTLAQKLREAQAWGEKARLAVGRAKAKLERLTGETVTDEVFVTGKSYIINNYDEIKAIGEVLANSPAFALSSLKAEVRREAFEEAAEIADKPGRNPETVYELRAKAKECQ